MPYIKQDDRSRVVTEIDAGSGVYFDKWMCISVEDIDTAGELQYAMAVMFKSYIERKGLNYQHCNDVMGALAGAQMEFNRQVVAPYEIKKEKLNGPI